MDEDEEETEGEDDEGREEIDIEENVRINDLSDLDGMAGGTEPLVRNPVTPNPADEEILTEITLTNEQRDNLNKRLNGFE